jgi:putative nucleotidyltransferase with HDIG domain
VSPASRFLASFGRALATLALYDEGHPALARAIDAAWRDLEQLLDAHPGVAFTFLGETILVGDLPLPDRRGWEWSERLSEAGIQRLEFDAPIAREAFDALLTDVFSRVTRRERGGGVGRPVEQAGIRYGCVGLQGEGGGPQAVGGTALPFSLREEIETVRWLHEEVRGSHPIPLAEVETVIRSLSVAIHANAEIVMPLLHLKEFDEYTTTHSLNVAVLSMGLAEKLGVAGRDVAACGVAGLLHDIGKTQVPIEILTKPGKLTAAERDLMNRHPEYGAREILRADQGLELAAVIAYEHHMALDGSGYPATRYSRPCHPTSRLIQVCDVFDALRTRRPYREAWAVERATSFLLERAGHEFDPVVVEAFVGLTTDFHSRIRIITDESHAEIPAKVA